MLSQNNLNFWPKYLGWNHNNVKVHTNTWVSTDNPLLLTVDAEQLEVIMVPITEIWYFKLIRYILIRFWFLLSIHRVLFSRSPSFTREIKPKIYTVLLSCDMIHRITTVYLPYRRPNRGVWDAIVSRKFRFSNESKLNYWIQLIRVLFANQDTYTIN